MPPKNASAKYQTMICTSLCKVSKERKKVAINHIKQTNVLITYLFDILQDLLQNASKNASAKYQRMIIHCVK